jgi:hypothetical protein
VTAGLGLASLLGLAALASEVGAREPTKDKTPPAIGPLLTEAMETSCHGTTVDFLDTPSEAAKRAKKEEKLVFILHVSGNFEDPKFT